MEHYKFFQNRECEYFPCHNGIPEQEFNCLFCYCPLYPLGENCLGNCRYTRTGIKDCSGCTRPHLRENYDNILKQMDAVLALAKRQDHGREEA